jgi:hypothetical protein
MLVQLQAWASSLLGVPLTVIEPDGRPSPARREGLFIVRAGSGYRPVLASTAGHGSGNAGLPPVPFGRRGDGEDRAKKWADNSKQWSATLRRLDRNTNSLR